MGVQSEKFLKDAARGPRLGLPQDAAARKRQPIVSGVLDYFPAALAAVALISVQGNEQHNPGEPLHWARSKSADHADCIARHLIERGSLDVDGARHTAKLAWRALALLQTELEEEAEAARAQGGAVRMEEEGKTVQVQVGHTVHRRMAADEALRRIQAIEQEDGK